MSTKLVKQEQLDKVKNRIQNIYTFKKILRVNVWLESGIDKESILVYGLDNNTLFLLFIYFNVADNKVYAHISNVIGNHELTYASIEGDHIVLDVKYNLYSKINVICTSKFSLWEFDL